MLRGRAKWLVLQRERASCGRDSVDIDRACPFRVLENLPNQSVGAECRPSLAGVISCDTVICRCVLSFTLPARPITVRVRKNGGLGRHRYRNSSSGCGWRDAHRICEATFAYLEHTWTYRYYFCCLERAPIWLKRLAVDACAAGTSTQSSPDVSGPADYCITRLDLRPAGTSGNQFAVITNRRASTRGFHTNLILLKRQDFGHAAAHD